MLVHVPVLLHHQNPDGACRHVFSQSSQGNFNMQAFMGAGLWRVPRVLCLIRACAEHLQLVSAVSKAAH